MITGFNTDVEHSGIVYHVQTEDKGVKSPLILSLVYVGGTILASKRTPYSDLIEAGFDEKILAERLQRQHKLICAAIRAGRIEDLKRQTERESGARAKTTEQTSEETTQPKATEETTRPKATEEDFIILHGNIADFMPPSSFMSPPESQTAEQSIEPPAPEVTAVPPASKETEHVDYSRVVDYSQNESVESDLQISLVEEKKFIAGEYVKILLRVTRGWDGRRSVANASVILKVLGSTFRPLLFSGKTANDGTIVFYALLPYFTSGRAAILVSVTDNGERAELRRVIHQP
ncbi:MAG TPA: hypothetical protein VKB86_04625 [Pyrinomonadaceae bacterium]|nr:hypothetical protein [Pyrinomonadaceae bacterium]